MGAFDDLIPGAAPAGGSPPPSGGFDDLVPKRGPIGEIAAAAQRGLYSGVRGAGEVLQAPAEMAHEEPGVISRFGQKLEAFGKGGEARPDLQPEPEKHNAVTNFLGKAAAAPGEALPLLASTIPAATAGAAAGSIVPGAGTAAGAVGGALASGLAGGSVTALQTYHEKYHEALDKGLSDDQARDYAAKSAELQGGLMGAASAVPFVGPAARAMGALPAKTAAGAIADVAGRRLLPELGKSAAEIAGVNTGLGVAGAAGQASIDQDTGLPTPSPGEAAEGSILPSLASAAGFLPLGVHAALGTARASKAVRTALEDPEAPTGDRLKAALQVHAAIERVDPDLAQAWDQNTAAAINDQRPIPLDETAFNRPAPSEPIPEAPVSTVDANAGPLSAAAAQSERATLPAFPFASPEAAQSSLAGRGPPPEGWSFQIERHPSVQNRWAVTLARAESETKSPEDMQDQADADRRDDLGRANKLMAEAVRLEKGAEREGLSDEAVATLTKQAKALRARGEALIATYGEKSDARPVEGGAGPDGGTAGGAADAAPGGGILAPDVSGESKSEGTTAPHLDALSHEAATSPLNDREEPTDNEKGAGNYKMGKPPPSMTQGVPISIENPAGSIRRSREGVEPPWQVVMPNHYGYIRGTVDRTGEHVDAFVGPHADTSKVVYVVDQIDPATKRYDEPKVMLGFGSKKDAIDAYNAGFSDGSGPSRMGAVTPMFIGKFREWVKDKSQTTKPLAYNAPKGAIESGHEEAAARNGEKPPVSGVAKHERPLLQPEESVLPQLRGKGDSREPGVGRELPDLRDGRGRAAESEPHAGSDEQRRALSAGERAVGYEKGTGPQHAEEPQPHAERQDADAHGMGGGNGIRPVDAAVSPEAGGHERGGSAHGAQEGRPSSAFGGTPLERVAAAADAVRNGSASPEALAELDRARQDAEKAGHSSREIVDAVGARKAEAVPEARPAEKAAALEEFQTRRGAVPTFDTSAQATRYQRQRTNRVPGNFEPRKMEDGWVLSRPKVERSAAQLANDRRLARARSTFDPERDHLATFMGKMGGINAEELLTDGVDPKDLKDLRSGVVAKPAYRTKGGLSLDGMAELAAQEGFDVMEDGRPDAGKLRDLIDEELAGTHIYLPQGYERLASLDAESRDAEARARAGNDFDETTLEKAGYDDLSEEGQDLVTQAFEDDLDGLIASFEHAGKGLTDDEADHLFRHSADTLPEEAEVAAARGAGEGPEDHQGPARREGEPPALLSRKSQGMKEPAPALDLKGETEAEIRAREALETKAAAEKKKRESAPSEKGFTLTGSDRAADVAEAHGQKPLFSRREAAPVFYSELAKRLEALPQKAGSPDQWKGVIDNLSSRGVKRDEIEWSGVKDWLAMQEGKVTREQVLDYLKQNGVKVEETMLGGKGSATNEFDGLRVQLDALGFDIETVRDPNTGQGVLDGLRSRASGETWGFVPGEGFEETDTVLPDRVRAIGERLADLEQEMPAGDIGGEPTSTRYSQYKLPGGENYRELLLTLPERGKAEPPTFEEWHARTHVQDIPAPGTALRRIADLQYEREKQNLARNAGTFRSGHFDQPNILAHIRMDDRVDAQGKKVLFLEELQSDWGQHAKRSGFRDEAQLAANRERLKTVISESEALAKDRNAANQMNDQKRWFRLADERDALYKEQSRLEHAPPSAPFVGKTEAWVGLALKRAIRYAAENGYDRVAWTNGEQQAARYDLSKHVDSILYAKNEDGSYRVSAQAQNRGHMLGENIAPDKLADFVGKDVADRIIGGKGERTEVQGRVEVGGGLSHAGGKEYMQKLSGIDLKIGGEGMKAFYDKIVPNVANDVLKKLGGGRVGEVRIKTGNAPDEVIARHPDNKEFQRANTAQPQPGFDITPAMREGAMQGLPLFSRAPEAKREGPVDIRRVASRLGVNAKFAETEGDLPDHLRDQIKAAKAEGDVRGLFDPKTGDVWLVGSNIKSEGEAVFVALHESAHRGLTKLFGEDLHPVLDQIYRTNDAVQARADELAKQYGYDQRRATEEVLADMALRGQAKDLKGWERFVEFLRTWLAKHGFPLKVSDEMAEFIAGAAANAGKEASITGEPPAKFSRAATGEEAKGPTNLMGLAAKLRDGLSDEVKKRDIARGGFRAALATMFRRMGQTDAALDQARKVVDSIKPEQRWEAMHQFQTGGVEAVADPRLKSIFAAWKANIDERTEKIQSWDEGYLQEVISNYFSQTWKNPDKAIEWYQRLMGKGPLEGGKAFLKRRTYANYQEGMSWKVFDDQGGVRYFASEKEARAVAGANDVVKPPLEPISTNFVDIAQLSLQQMDKFIAMHEYRQWLKEEKGWVKRVRRGERQPMGYAKVDDPAFRTQAVFPITDKEMGKAAAAALTYDYMVPEMIAKDLNNYLSNGLYQFGFWRNFRYAQNLLLSARLGFSAFHAGFTTMDTLVSHTDVGARYLLQGDVGRAVSTWVKALTSPITAPLEGRRLLKQFYGEAAADPDTAAVLHFLTEGGARGRMNPTDFNNSWATLKRAWADGKIKDTAFHALPAVMEGVMRPIMHYLVPWQKMTARALLAKFELDRVAASLGKKPGEYKAIIDAMGDDAMRQIAYKVVQQVDDRLGQVAYENLFWNKFAKDIAQASIQSVGWNVGTANVILGGAKDVARLVNPEELLGPLDKAGQVNGNLGRITGRLSYLISLNLTVGMMGAILQYAMTGQDPKDLRDYFFPRTGRKNPDGSDERISMPSYIKDEYALSQHPITTIQHKLHPTFSMVAELLKNEDFYGNQIVNPDDPWTKVAKQAVDYLGKSVEPYAVQNLQQNRSKGETGPMSAAPFVGITPAPASVSRTPFEAYVAERYAAAFHETQTPEGAEKAQARRAAITALKNGTQPDLSLFTPHERMSIFTASRTPVQQQRFNRLSLPAKLTAWDKATPEERAQFHLKQAIVRDFTLHQTTLDPDVRTKALEVIRAG